MIYDKDSMGLIAIIFALVTYGSYIYSVLRRQTKPHAFSWSVWGILMGIVFVAQMQDGAASGGWVTGFSAACCLIIAAMAIARGEKDIRRSDWVAFIGALAIIPVWYMTRDPLTAIILAAVIDALACYPTFRKSWHKPHEEYYATYFIDILKWLVAIPALGSFTAVTLIYPLFLIANNSALVGMILFRRAYLAGKKTVEREVPFEEVVEPEEVEVAPIADSIEDIRPDEDGLSPA